MTKFDDILELIYRKSPLQKKTIQELLARQDTLYFEHAEAISKVFLRYLESEGLFAEDWVNAYLKMCSLQAREQIRFGKTGTYQNRTFESCYDAVYSDARQMHIILSGLALSLLLWENHYKILSFFKECLAVERPNTYCEIGAGHGLFLIEAFRLHAKLHACVVDVSPKAIDICRNIVAIALPLEKNIEFAIEDILHSDFSQQQFDFIFMGEVIEHVNNPKDLLTILKPMLRVNGKAFVTTCCNCPSIDHVYLFKNVDEIRLLIKSAGLHIVRELVLPNNMNWVIDGKYSEGINYAALLS